MSTPHVSGVAALLLSYKPDTTPDELFAAITHTAVDRGANGLDNSYGYGVIDALAAVKHLEELGDSGNRDNANNPTPTRPTPEPSDQPYTTPIWTVIFANDFESGLGNFNDPGSDVRLYSGRKHSHSGSKSLQLRDDTATSLSFTKPFTVSSYSTLKVEFWYKSSRFRHAPDAFLLQSADGKAGTEWVTKGSWTYNVNDFTSNGVWRFASVQFQIDTRWMRIRFQNNGHNNKERIYIDDVIVAGN
jgi:hypothetical protein